MPHVGDVGEGRGSGDNSAGETGEDRVKGMVAMVSQHT